MTLPDIILDDRDFQSLVDEARKRIADNCPEWNEHNVSDPGITLIEIFAWMTELLLYRVNRVPEKLQLALLNLLQVQRSARRAAQVQLRFTLAASPQMPVRIPQGTQVVAPGDPARGAIVFTVRQDTEIARRSLAAVRLERSGRLTPVPVEDGVARPVSDDRAIFSSPPPVGDALLLGVEDPIANLVLDIDLLTTEARGTAARPDSPPFVWEVSARVGGWSAAKVLLDSTGSLNFATGTVRLQIPADAAPATVDGITMYWLRCSVAEGPSGDASQYIEPPRVEQLQLSVTGILVSADHHTTQLAEFLGHSDGTPGQRFVLHHQPTLPLQDDDEHLEVRDPTSGDWMPWKRVDSLADSSAIDPHYTYDPVAGEVEVGIAVRAQSGWKQFGAIPPAGAAIRMSRYRHGGGAIGNVDAGKLTGLRHAVIGVASVSNPSAAWGGVDAQSLEEVLIRAPGMLRTCERAVTPSDFELLVERECPRVARVRCGTPPPGQAIPVYVLPVITDPHRRLDPEELRTRPELVNEVREELRPRCLCGVSVHVAPVALHYVTATVELLVRRADRAQLIEQQVLTALYEFINPYVGGQQPTVKSGRPWGQSLRAGELARTVKSGWPWGQSLHAGELAPTVRQIPDGDDILSLTFIRLYSFDPATARPSQRQIEGIHPGSDELVASGQHFVRAIVADASDRDHRT